MQIEICNDKETRRQTGNNGWSMPTGPVSRKIAARALELKGLIQRDMATQSVELANAICNRIIEDTEDVAVLETAPLIGG